MSIATVVVLEHGKGLITPVSLEVLKCDVRTYTIST